jgi:ActR/RegA family two-component response regulator
MDNSTYEARLELAIDDLAKQANPNVLATARRFQVHCTTLSRRFQGTQQNRRIAHSET